SCFGHRGKIKVAPLSPCGGALCRPGPLSCPGAQLAGVAPPRQKRRKGRPPLLGALLDPCRKGWRVRANERKRKLTSPIFPQEGQGFLQDLTRLVATDSLNL